MKIALVTGSSGLIGSEAATFFSAHFDKIVGIDNDMRAYFFGKEASTEWNRLRLNKQVENYEHKNVDIRENSDIEKIFTEYNKDIKLIIHSAAQPSHDWAASEPHTDFSVNAVGTLNLLEATRKHCPEATFILTSTNKVYGDTPNRLPLIELEHRYEIDESHPYFKGIDESMSVDQCKHSLFGASKLAGDILTQEYGKYFGMNTGVFRGGCLTGPKHSGAELHGFLSYLIKCIKEDKPYTIFGYKGKQVRDNIHSYDLVNMFHHFHQSPKPGEVYNAGGSRHSNCSMLEVIQSLEEKLDKKLNYTYAEENRIGDHIWYISDVRKFEGDYPDWSFKYNLEDIINQILES